MNLTWNPNQQLELNLQPGVYKLEEKLSKHKSGIQVRKYSCVNHHGEKSLHGKPLKLVFYLKRSALFHV